MVQTSELSARVRSWPAYFQPHASDLVRTCISLDILKDHVLKLNSFPDENCQSLQHIISDPRTRGDNTASPQIVVALGQADSSNHTLVRRSSQPLDILVGIHYIGADQRTLCTRAKLAGILPTTR